MTNKYTACVFVLIALFFTCNIRKAFSQNNSSDSFTPIQFVQNNGQWDSRILYKGDLPGNGHVFLRKDGFAYTLFNQQDLQKMEDHFHGEMGENHNPASKSNAGNADSRLSLPPANNSHLTNNSGGGAGSNTMHGTGHDQDNDNDNDDVSPSSYIIRGQMYEVNFLGANKEVAITNDHPDITYYNYFIGSDPKKWASHVHSYASVTYKNMYNNVDVRVYSEASQLKYDLILYPGADLNNIRLAYKGTNGLSIEKGQLHVATDMGDVVELSPYSYQIINNQKVELNCSYKVDHNTLSFKISGRYNKNYPVIIDPTLVFSTFTGSKSDNWGYTATYDAQGDLYDGGIVFGAGYPVYPTKPGPFQATFGGGTVYEGIQSGFDMGISKFNPTGTTMIYSTYIGGSSNEQPHSLIVNSKGDLIIAGRTESSDYPLYPKGNSQGSLGGWDIVVTELNPTGTGLVGSIKIGGSNNDGVNITDNRTAGTLSLLRFYGDDARSEVVVDGADNVYLASCTQSADFPIIGKVFQQIKGDATSNIDIKNRAGNYYNYYQQDGVLIKLKPDLSAIDWSSFLGGNEDDAAYVLKLDNAGNIYVAGATSSNNLKSTAGVIQPTFSGGDADGFIAEVSNDGSTLKRLTYLGTSATDEIYGIGLDKSGYIYVCGTTEGKWPITSNAYYRGIDTLGKQFIAKLQPDLSAYVYSTVFGTNSTYPNISPVAFLVDRCENVYVSGWGGINWPPPSIYREAGTTGLPITPGAIKSTTDGDDFYFFVLQKNASAILYASYFGQDGGLTDHVDGGTSRFDPNGIIYEAICANCGHQARFPTTPGVWSPTNGSADCNLVGLKIAFNLDGVHAGLRTKSGDTSGCIPYTVDLEDTILKAKSYVWDFGDGSPKIATTSPTETHTYTKPGLFTVTLVAIDSNSCNVADTTYLHIKTGDNPASLGFTAQKLPPCTNLTYLFTNTSTPPPGQPFGPTSFAWNLGNGTPTLITGTNTVTEPYPTYGTYNITLQLLDTTYCNYKADTTETIRIAANVKAIISILKNGCMPYLAQFNNESQGGLNFQWYFGDKTGASNQVNPTHLYGTTGNYVVTLIANDSTTCNKTDTATDTITVHPNPIAGFNFSPIPPQENTPEMFTNTSTGASDYFWDFGDGTDDTVMNPSHFFPKTGTFNVCLEAVNQWGCLDSLCQPVSAIIVPGFGIPSAFSPNGDGLNDVFKIRGFGITRFSMAIYNRWGQLVFETHDPNQGWDGTYKGKPQPMDAYGYVVNIEFNDGTKTTKTGSVTLLR